MTGNKSLFYWEKHLHSKGDDNRIHNQRQSVNYFKEQHLITSKQFMHTYNCMHALQKPKLWSGRSSDLDSLVFGYWLHCKSIGSVPCGDAVTFTKIYSDVDAH